MYDDIEDFQVLCWCFAVVGMIDRSALFGFGLAPGYLHPGQLARRQLTSMTYNTIH